MATESNVESGRAAVTEAEKAPARRIPGNLTYITNHGTIKVVLDKISSAARPDKFSVDFLSTVLGMSGGSARAVIPILKRVGFLTSDGTPTDIYSKFKTESARPQASLAALRLGFAELFKRNEHVYAATDSKLTDLIVEVTGLKRDDTVVRAIRGTFRVFSSYLPAGYTSTDAAVPAADTGPAGDLVIEGEAQRKSSDGGPPLALSYQINIVLPETRDIEVYNYIFKSLRDNLLRP